MSELLSPRLLQADWQRIEASVYLLAIWIVVLRTEQTSAWKLALLSLPGTILHELLHFCVGLILGARPVAFSLIPRRAGKRWILGSVSFARITLFNAAPTAFAPLLMLPVAWVLFADWMLPAFWAGAYGIWLVWGYLTACCLLCSMPSWVDIKLGASSALFWAGLGGGIWMALPS